LRGFVRKYEEKRSIGKHRHRWEGNIKVDFKEFDWEGVNKRLGLEEGNTLQGPMNLILLHDHLMNFCVLKQESVPCSWLVNITLKFFL
jgi:hypothetical protein